MGISVFLYMGNSIYHLYDTQINYNKLILKVKDEVRMKVAEYS